MQSLRPESVLDIGANTGQYSRIAASAGARVVAWDTDVTSSDRNWKEAREGGLPILPLVADVARPTPAVGWCNTESLTLGARHQRFDCVMMLGIIHHLLLADQFPWPAWPYCWHRSLVLEHRGRVPKTDVRYIDLCRGRDELYAHLEEDLFVEQFTRHFNIMAREELGNGRVLFLFEKDEPQTVVQGLEQPYGLDPSRLAPFVRYHPVIYHSFLPTRSVIWGVLLDLGSSPCSLCSSSAIWKK